MADGNDPPATDKDGKKQCGRLGNKKGNKKR